MMYVPHTGMQALGGGALAPVCWLPASRSWRKIGTPIAIADAIWPNAGMDIDSRLS